MNSQSYNNSSKEHMLNYMYYVYEHYIDERLFYIGKGVRNRAYDFKGRNTDWKELVGVRTHDVKVKIVGYFESESDALDYEEYLIKKYDLEGASLTNFTYNETTNNKLLKSKVGELEKFISSRGISTKKLNNILQLSNYVETIKSNSNSNDNKIVVVSSNAVTINKLNKLALSKNYNPLILWDNTDYNEFMNYHQIELKDEILIKGVIPEDYNFIIVDYKVANTFNFEDVGLKTAVINTSNINIHYKFIIESNLDIDVFIYRTNENIEETSLIDLAEEYVNIPLTTSMKEELCSKLGLINKSGTVSQWVTVKPLIIKSGYSVKDVKRVINGKRCRVSIIGRDE